MTKIIVDYREKPSGIIKELSKHELDVEVKQLIVADFIIQGKTYEEKIINIGIEKKTKQDFLNSIIDKRILNQLQILKENFDIPLLIIEGIENIYSIRNFHPNAIRGMLASIAIDYQIPIIYTRNYRDTANLLLTIVKRLEKPKKYIGLLKKKKPLSLKEQQELMIESLPLVGPKTAKSLLKRYKTIKKIANLKEEQLKKIEKIGPKKAKKIIEILKKEYE